MSDAVIAFTTTSNKKEAKKLAKKMVEGRLAACVNVVPKIKSFYEWEGAIHDEEEYLLIIKTTRQRFDSVREFISRNHSYECPEFISLNISDGLPAYLEWINDMTS